MVTGFRPPRPKPPMPTPPRSFVETEEYISPYRREKMRRAQARQVELQRIGEPPMLYEPPSAKRKPKMAGVEDNSMDRFMKELNEKLEEGYVLFQEIFICDKGYHTAYLTLPEIQTLED